MKSAFVILLAATSLSMGACAHMGEETAALTPNQMRAELASVTQELKAIEAAYVEDRRQQRAQSLVTILNRPATASNGQAASEYTPQIPLRYKDRAIARITFLIERRDELKAQMAQAGAFTADEIRAQIQEIDSKLASVRLADVPSNTGQTNFLRPATQNYAFSASSNAISSPGLRSDVVLRTPVSSTGMRASAWRMNYRLKEEREALYARLQVLEASQQ